MILQATEERKAGIYTDFRDKVFGYIRGKISDPDLAEDLCADVFLKVYEKLDSYDEQKAALSTWIYTITRNTLVDYFRTRHSAQELPEELAATEDVEDGLCREETLETLAAALEKLDERERNIIIRRYYSGMTLKEIAAQMDISYAYVKLLHNKALSALREYF